MPKTHQSLKGQILLDGGKLRGSFFHRSVVLICEHNAEGAFGLVLNRPSENKLSDVITTDLPERLKAETLFGGGPVQPAAMSFLHSDNFVLNANVIDNLNVGHDLDDLVELGESWSPTQRVRVFAGYAGWSPGQLDDEMKREAWLTHPASVDLVFFMPAEKLWRHLLLQRSSWKERLLAEAPDDLAWN